MFKIHQRKKVSCKIHTNSKFMFILRIHSCIGPQNPRAQELLSYYACNRNLQLKINVQMTFKGLSMSLDPSVFSHLIFS